MAEQKYTALVLAGSRRGVEDPLLEAGGVSHKCFIDIAGEPMLRRVVGAVLDSGRVQTVHVSLEEDSIEEARAVLSPLGREDRIRLVASRATLADSVLAVTDADEEALPLVITTGDNALHTAEMVAYFCNALDSCEADAGLGLTRAEVMMERFPDGARAFHRFRDGAFSSCNLYALLTPGALRAPRVFATGGQFAKKPWRLIKTFGIMPFLIYKSRKATLAGFLKSLSRPLKIRVEPVFMPFAEGPIDVDRVSDWRLANEIVAARLDGEGRAG